MVRPGGRWTRLAPAAPGRFSRDLRARRTTPDPGVRGAAGAAPAPVRLRLSAVGPAQPPARGGIGDRAADIPPGRELARGASTGGAAAAADRLAECPPDHPGHGGRRPSRPLRLPPP